MKKKTHGGAGRGQGRKPGVTFKEPTVVIRVPKSEVKAIRKYLKSRTKQKPSNGSDDGDNLK